MHVYLQDEERTPLHLLQRRGSGGFYRHTLPVEHDIHFPRWIGYSRYFTELIYTCLYWLLRMAFLELFFLSRNIPYMVAVKVSWRSDSLLGGTFPSINWASPASIQLMQNIWNIAWICLVYGPSEQNIVTSSPVETPVGASHEGCIFCGGLPWKKLQKGISWTSRACFPRPSKLEVDGHRCP